MWLCATCRIKDLEDHKSWPGQKCNMVGCDKTAQQHMDEGLRELDAITTQMTNLEGRHPRDNEPGILERRGTTGHPFPRRGHKLQAPPPPKEELPF